MKRIYIYLLLAILQIWLTGCAEIQDTISKESQENVNLEILSITFDDDYKKFDIEIKMKEGTSYSLLEDFDQIQVKVKEYNHEMKELVEKAQPYLIEIERVKSKMIDDLGMKALVLVDLTLDEILIDKQKKSIEKLKSLFSKDNLYVAFMKDNTVSESYLATEYVIENYFQPNRNTKQLYRSIASKIDELKGRKSPYFSSVVQDTIWKTIPTSKKILIVFSDGQTYMDNMPIDPDHFELQRRLMMKEKEADKFPIYYVNFQEQSEDPLDVVNEAETFVSLMCKQTGGSYYSVFNWLALSKVIIEEQLVDCADFKIKMQNPNHKIFRGDKRWLSVDFSVGDSVLFYGKKSYSLGHHYHPIIINGHTTGRIVVLGCFLTFCLLIFIYTVFQFIVPAVRYMFFKKRYVVKYTGKNMAIHDIQVEEVCYYCKAPFEEGDEIVVKCEHAMHKSCWDENEYKCPEYGRKCQHGSHYYNQHKIYDLRNASFYMNWILAGTIAGISSWICFLLNRIHIGYDYLVHFIFNLFNVDIQSNEAIELFGKYKEELSYTPFYGLYVCFFLTLFLSALSSHGNWWWKRIAFVLIKAVLAGVGGYLSFVVIAIVSLALDLSLDFLLIDWIPWILNGFIIAYLVSYQTEIKLYNALKGATITAFLGIGTMYLWEYTHDAQMDMRNFLLMSIIVYCIGLAVTMAVNSPQSERYFLRVEGAIKTMDIAIYKWMNTQFYNRRVTIGRSVDCNLQVTWDINSDIAPIQAEVVSDRGNLYLIALETGVVMNKKPVNLEKKIRLYHGDKFTIGQTIFTYIEKDI
jgi:hypothetical protein